MHLDPWTLALQTINLLLLVWLLGRFLFRPIARIVEERQAAIARTIEDARAMREEADKARTKAREEAERIETQRVSVLEQASQAGEKEKVRLIEEARLQASREIDQARGKIEEQREAAMARYASHASQLAVDIAARLLDRLPDGARLAGFTDGLASALAGLPDSVRDEIGCEGAEVTLKAAVQPSDAQLRKCRKAITAALGREVDMTLVVDQGLIAGWAIEARHVTIGNSLRDDLDRIAAELTRGSAADGA